MRRCCCRSRCCFRTAKGLSFEEALLKDKGVEGAFAGVLDRPPSTSYEILNPKSYERAVKVPLLQMPDVHGLLDAEYDPYDIGVMGALDVRMLTELFAGEEAAVALTPEWDGRHLLRSAEQEREDSGAAGANEFGGADVFVGVERP